jgi:hypothetical protein
MKKLVLIITMLVVMFAVSAQAQTEASKMPAEVQTALHKAIKAEQADPPIDAEFLYNLSFEEGIKEYVEVFKSSIVIPLGEGQIVIESDDHGRPSVTVSYKGGYTDTIKCGDLPYFSGEAKKGDAFQCAMLLKEYLADHRQSEFWTALKSAV